MSATPPATDGNVLAAKLLAVLERHGSRVFARQALNVGLRTVGVPEHELRPEHLERLVEETMAAFRVFVDAEARQRLWIDLVDLCEREGSAPP